MSRLGSTARPWFFGHGLSTTSYSPIAQLSNYLALQHRHSTDRRGKFAAIMECQFGITGKGYSIIASDSNAARSIVKMKGDEDKMKELSKHLVMAYSGEAGR